MAGIQINHESQTAAKAQIPTNSVQKVNLKIGEVKLNILHLTD